MLPDLTSFRQHSDDIENDHSLEQPGSKRPSKSKGFDKPAKKRDRTQYPKKKKRPKPVSQYVVETLSDFLALWPHRYDYLYSPHPDPGTKPSWYTETRHPLSDRLIAQGTYLYGVRPGSNTSYGLIDIDKGSPYHPQHDPLALDRINEALEPLGLVANLKLTSSDSLGLHVYYPLTGTVPSWQLAIAIATLLENAGFKIMSGWLEVFPNRKPFAAEGNYSLFNGHRLPLQQGSYLLNNDLQPIASSHQAFVRQWHGVAARNDIDASVLKQIIRQAQRKAYKVTGKAQKFLNDLNAEIEPGWSGPGQTNHILGRITMRCYIFGHIIGAETPLNGKALVEEIVKVARALPGFKDYCGHQKDLVQKAKEWARSIESKERYFPYASGKAFKAKQGPTWNEQQAAEAREHIRQVVIELCQQEAFPEKTAARFKLLCSHHVSGETLYRNRDLWHPVHISEQQQKLIEVVPHSPELYLGKESACAGGAADSSQESSLLGGDGRNTPSDNASSNPIEAESGQNQGAGRNIPSDAAFSLIEAVESEQPIERTQPPEQLSLNIQWALQVVHSKQREQVEKNRQQYQKEKQQRARTKHIAQLNQWMDSGDPILVAEAERQLSRVGRAARSG